MNKRLFIFLAVLLVAECLQAQLSELGSNPFMSDVNGRPMYLQTNYRAEGSPYYHEAYLIADITSLAGKVFPKVKVRLNVQTNELFYMGENGAEMLASLPVRSIRFIAVTSEDGQSEKVLHSVGPQPINSPNAVIYEKVDTGRITVLKQIKITYNDTKEFNQSTIVRTYKRKETWHLLLADGNVAKFETGKDELLTTLRDKQKEITAYIDKEKLKCRSIDDCRKVVSYYNTLF